MPLQGCGYFPWLVLNQTMQIAGKSSGQVYVLITCKPQPTPCKGCFLLMLALVFTHIPILLVTRTCLVMSSESRAASQQISEHSPCELARKAHKRVHVFSMSSVNCENTLHIRKKGIVCVILYEKAKESWKTKCCHLLGYLWLLLPSFNSPQKWAFYPNP